MISNWYGALHQTVFAQGGKQVHLRRQFNTVTGTPTMAPHHTTARTSLSAPFNASPRAAARAIAIPARGRQRGRALERNHGETLLLVALALVAGTAIFSFSLQVTEDLVLSLMAPVFAYLLVASLIAAKGR